MALDAALLALLAGELNAALAGARADKLHQPSRDEVLLLLRGAGGGAVPGGPAAGEAETAGPAGSEAAAGGSAPAGPAAGEPAFGRPAAGGPALPRGEARLLLSARTGSARIQLTDERFENPQNPPSFCMLLRKHLLGGKLLRIAPLAGDRVVFFDFLCRSEIGDLVYNTLAAELMGRYCNLVLVRKPRDAPMEELAKTPSSPPAILDALKRVNFEDSALRQLLPGLPYTLPPQQARPNFMAAPVADILAAAGRLDAPAAAALAKAAGGVGPVVVREAVFRGLGAAAEKPLSKLTPEEYAALTQAILDIRADYARGGAPCLACQADGSPAEFSFTRLTQYLPGCGLYTYSGFSRLLDAYYAERGRAERMRQKSKELRRTAAGLYERALRRQAARTEDLAAGENSGALRLAGELLMANLPSFKKGDTKVRLQSWESGEEVEIALDPRYTPSQNAQKYFKEYKRRQTAAKKLAGLLESGKRELNYLATVLYELDSAEGEAALAEIREELQGQGYLRSPKQRVKRPKPADFLRYRSGDGFLILVGRNNAQNEKLSLKTARGGDLWFHVKNAPGSHVVVLCEGRAAPPLTQNQAAMLAVWHSGQKNGAKVAVDYTQARHLRKTGDLPPGMVLYEHYETAWVTPLPGELPPKEGEG